MISLRLRHGPGCSLGVLSRAVQGGQAPQEVWRKGQGGGASLVPEEVEPEQLACGQHCPSSPLAGPTLSAASSVLCSLGCSLRRELTPGLCFTVTHWKGSSPLTDL